MRLEYEDYGEVVVLTPMDPRLDAAIAREFRDAALEMIQPQHKICALDLSHVTFVDSTGIGAMIALMNGIGRERRLEVCGPAPMVRKVFRMTRLDTVFNIEDSLAPVLASVSGESGNAAI